MKKKLTRAEQKALRPTQILDAAFEEFVNHGFAAARVEDIADRVGVTKGTIYVYFPTKEELFGAMIRHIAVPFEDLLAETNDLEGTCADKLRSLIKLFYDRILDNRRTRELLRFVVSEGMRFPQIIDAHRNELVEPLLIRAQSLIDEGIAGGQFRDGPAALSRVVVAPVIAMAMEILIHDSRRDLDVAAYVEAHIDLVMAGLAMHPGSMRSVTAHTSETLGEKRT